MRYELVVVESRDLGIPYAARPDEPLPEPGADVAAELARLIPVAFAVRHGLVPLSFDGETLTVAMARPADAPTLRGLRLITRCQVQPLSATRAQVRAAISRFYRGIGRIC